jgi:hypothetical protein
MKRFWRRLGGPIKIGLVVGMIGALLTVIGLFTTGFAPLTLRSLLLGILLGGGSWGVVSWAIAAAAADAAADATSDAASAPADAAASGEAADSDE